MKDGGLILPPGGTNVPSTTTARGFWNLQEANNRWSALNYQWPGGIDPNFANVVGLWHCGFPTPITGTVEEEFIPNAVALGPPLQLFGTSVGGFGLGSGAKFGSLCLLTENATSAYATAASTWAPTNGDWTIEGWIWASSTGGLGFVYESRSNPPGVTLQPSVYYDGAGTLNYYFSGAIQISATLPTDSWHHWAVCKASNNTRVFIDGTQSGITLADTNNYLTSQILWFATSNASATFVGRMQELRITQGVGRYTANFAAPVYPFPDF